MPSPDSKTSPSDQTAATAPGSSDSPRNFIVFYVNGKRQQLGGGLAFSSLAQYLRDQLGLLGTRLVCTEGDCGACTVLLGRQDGDQLRYEAVTSCILALHQVHHGHVVTVEGLNQDGRLSAVQAAMVEHHGSQCGYCTSGMIMALTAAFAEDRQADAMEIKRALAGNLCRCTGYLPIVEAALATNRSQLRSPAELYPDRAMIEDFKIHVPVPVLIEQSAETSGSQPERLYFRPRRLEDALAFKAQNPDAVVVAGGTAIGVDRNMRAFRPRALLSLQGLAELGCIRQEGERVSIGANVTWRRVEEYARNAMPEFHEIARRFASPQTRNLATLVGNVAFGSPVADSIGYLTVMGAELELASQRGLRRLLVENFHQGYKETAIQPDEVITRLLIPQPGPDELLRLYKISKRREMDMTTFRAAIRVARRGETIEKAILAYSGIGALTCRLRQTEAFLAGKPFREETFLEAGVEARREMEAVPDARGLRDYRLQLAQNVLPKFYFDCIAGERQEEEVGI